MGLYNRDRGLNDISITLTGIEELFNLCLKQADALRRADPNLPGIRVSAGIRYDQKGATVFSYSDLESEYKHAVDVERITFNIERVNAHGIVEDRFLILPLDKVDTLRVLEVSFGDQNWVNSAFSAFDESLRTKAAWYRVVRSVLVELLIQIVGVCAVFLVSLIAAKRLAPRLALENSYLLAFLFVFLLTANVWGFMQKQIHPLTVKLFPNVRFIREGQENTHWFIQAIVSTVVLGVAAIVLSYVATLFSGELASIIVTTP